MSTQSSLVLVSSLLNLIWNWRTTTPSKSLKTLKVSEKLSKLVVSNLTSILDEPNNKLLITAALIPGQIADARAEFLIGGAKKELFHASLKLDENNFLRPDSAIDNNNIKEFLEKARQVSEEQLKQLTANVKEGAQGITDDLKEIGSVIKETVPDCTKTQQFYQSELNKIKEEISADKSLEQIAVIL